MANCTLKETSAKTGPKGSGSAVFKYELIADSVIIDPLDALAVARGLGVPQYGTALGSAYWFAQDFSVDRNQNNRNHWDITVTFSPPPDGEDDSQQNENPLARPAVYDVQYVEQEFVIEQARNREAFGPVFTRAPGTYGPIVNATFDRPDEPKVATTRNAVIIIEKNYPDLGAIMALNEQYQLTTNSDTVNIGGESIAPNRLVYLGTFSGGRQQEGEVVYYPGRTEIELKKTSDLVLMNVSYKGWDPVAAEYVEATVKGQNGTKERASDPVNIDLNGEFCGDTTTTISYYYLDEVAYSGFFGG